MAGNAPGPPIDVIRELGPNVSHILEYLLMSYVTLFVIENYDFIFQNIVNAQPFFIYIYYKKKYAV